MLKQLQIIETPTTIQQDPSRTCEACGTVVDGSRALNIMMQIGVAGHPSISPFQCPFEEHWACSLVCWKAVAHACIDEHMHVILQQQHSKLSQDK